MNRLTKVNDEWMPLQKKVFTRWVNFQLKNQSSVSIHDITKDLSDGVVLIRLAIVLAKTKAPRSWKSQPKRIIDMVMNCDLAIEMFASDGVKFFGISGKDINDNNEKVILSLIWTLILHYTIGDAVITSSVSITKNNNFNAKTSSKNHKQVILSWANERLSSYSNIQDFTPYGLMLCALLDSYVPGKINYFSLDPKDLKNNTKLAEGVMNELHIPVYADSDDILKYRNRVDEKTLLTQLSSIKIALENRQKNENSKIISEIEHKANLVPLDVKECNVIINQTSNSQQSKDNKKNEQQNSINNDKNSRLVFVSIDDYDINQTISPNIANDKKDVESQTFSIKMNNSDTETRFIDNQIEKLKKEFEDITNKYQSEIEQLRKELADSETCRKELEAKITKSEEMSKQEIQQIKISQANSEANAESFKKAFEQASAKIVEEQEINKKITAIIHSMRISQAKSEANVALFKKAFENAQAEIQAEKEAKQKVYQKTASLKEGNDKVEAEFASQSMSNDDVLSLKESFGKLKRRYQMLEAEKANIEDELKEERFMNCKMSSLISSYRLAKERAELQAAEFKEAKEKAEKESDSNIKAKLKAKAELKELQDAMERCQSKAAIHQEQKEKAVAEANHQKKAKNMALFNAHEMRIAKSKAEDQFANIKRSHEKVMAEANAAKVQAQQMKTYKEKAETQVKQMKIVKSQAEAEAKRIQEAKDKAEQLIAIEREAKVNAEQAIAIEHEAKVKAEQNVAIEREAKEKIEAELEAQKHVNEIVEAEIRSQKEAQKKAENEILRTKKEKEQADEETKILSQALIDAQRNAKENEQRNAQKLMIAETEAERLGRALVFAESEAKRLMKELEEAKQKKNEETPKDSKHQNQLAVKFEDEKDARIKAQAEARALTKALSEAWKKAKEQGHPIDGNNKHYPKSNFGLTMTLNKSDYNNGKKIDVQRINIMDDEKITLSLTLVKDDKPFLNSSGLKLDLAPSNVEHDRHQQFAFDIKNDDTIIKSFVKDSMVWDVADQYSLNPPEGTPFYLFPVHGRHNQHFVYKDGMIYAQQNGQVVTYVGGEVPFVMMIPSHLLKDRQMFDIKFF